MLFVVGGLVIVGMMLVGLGLTWASRAHDEDDRVRPHFGTRPVTPLAQARPGDIVQVLGTIESQDVVTSPSGAPPSAYLAVDLACLTAGYPSYLALRHGDVLHMRDASGTATVQMNLANTNTLDRLPYERIWFTGSAPPKRVQRVIHQHSIRLPRPPRNKGPLELRYRETAFRRGDPLRVHGLVMGVEESAEGLRHVTLGTDQRAWLYVSNATDGDLKRLRAKARKWLKIGIGVLAVGVAMTVTGIAIGASLAP